jgi:undecaprenyl diphosphate synthase
MGFNREVLRRRRDQLNAWGVRIRWAGRRPKLWASVITELQEAERLTQGNNVLTLTMCVNYGSRIELVDAMNEISREIAAGKLKPGSITEKTVQRHLLTADLPDVDLFIRSSGEQRASNFLLWQSAYAEFVFLHTLWPDFTRKDLWEGIEIFLGRDRRFGGALDAPK